MSVYIYTHTHRSVLIDSQECACVRLIRKPMMGTIYKKKNVSNVALLLVDHESWMYELL